MSLGLSKKIWNGLSKGRSLGVNNQPKEVNEEGVQVVKELKYVLKFTVQVSSRF